MSMPMMAMVAFAFVVMVVIVAFAMVAMSVVAMSVPMSMVAMSIVGVEMSMTSLHFDVMTVTFVLHINHFKARIWIEEGFFLPLVGRHTRNINRIMAMSFHMNFKESVARPIVGH